MTTLRAASSTGTSSNALWLCNGEQAHGSIPKRTPQGTARCRFIQNMVALGLQVNVGLLSAATRQRAPVAFARQVAMYLAHVACGLTLTDVGHCFGRDRTTVAHACRSVEDRRDDPGIDLMLDFFEAAVLDWFSRSSGQL